MDRQRARRRSLQPVGLAAVVLSLSLCATAPLRVAAQQADRERAQMLQMQQQLQRLQSDNAAIQKERNELQGKAQEAEKLKKESDKTGAELARIRQSAAVQGKELGGLRAELAASNAKLASAQAELEVLRKAVADRNDALQAAAIEKRRMEAGQALLAARLKAQTEKVDLCESRHAGLMQFTSEVIERYEGDRLRLCEPITGIWKIRPQTQIEQMREHLYSYRLDIPAPRASAPAAAGADAGAAPAAVPAAAPAPAPEPAKAPAAAPEPPPPAAPATGAGGDPGAAR
jgi:hypothetical protein